MRVYDPKATAKATAPVHQNEVDEAGAVASSVTELKIPRPHRLRVFSGQFWELRFFKAYLS